MDAQWLGFVCFNVSEHESQENKAGRIARHNAEEEPLIRMHKVTLGKYLALMHRPLVTTGQLCLGRRVPL